MECERLLMLERSVERHILSILSKMVDLVYQELEKDDTFIDLYQFDKFRLCLIDALDNIDPLDIGNIILLNMYECLPLIEKYVRSNKEKLVSKYESNFERKMILFKQIVESVPEE